VGRRQWHRPTNSPTFRTPNQGAVTEGRHFGTRGSQVINRRVLVQTRARSPCDLPQHSVGPTAAPREARVSAAPICRQDRRRSRVWTPGALGHLQARYVVIPENKDPHLQVFHGASRTRTGDLLGAIQALNEAQDRPEPARSERLRPAMCARWRTHWRTETRIPANRYFPNGLENRYPSLGGSRVRIPPPPPSPRSLLFKRVLGCLRFDDHSRLAVSIVNVHIQAVC
jgi:hypothetical protein